MKYIDLYFVDNKFSSISCMVNTTIFLLMMLHLQAKQSGMILRHMW